MLAREKRRYLISTNGLTGEASYLATDPDQALMFAHRYERYKRARQSQPNMATTQLSQIAKDECEIPGFRIKSCILEQ
jgi:hypothetical protein